MIDAWRLEDDRISYNDIIDRQTEDAESGLKKPKANALGNQIHRGWRKLVGTWVEYDKRGEPHKTDVEAIEKMTFHNLMSNSLLHPCEIAPDRLQRVRFFRGQDDANNDDDGQKHFHVEPLEVTLENLEETTLPGDYFKKGFSKAQEAKLGLMTTGMIDAFTCLLILQERAELHRIDDWRRLPPSCLPESWFDRTTSTKSARKVNEAYDGGCEICTWNPERKILPPKDTLEEVPLAGTKRKRTRRSTGRAAKQDAVVTPAERVRKGKQTRESTAQRETHDDFAADMEMESGNDSTSVNDDSAQDSGLVNDGYEFQAIGDISNSALANEDETLAESAPQPNVALNGGMHKTQRFTPINRAMPSAHSTQLSRARRAEVSDQESDISNRVQRLGPRLKRARAGRIQSTQAPTKQVETYIPWNSNVDADTSDAPDSPDASDFHGLPQLSTSMPPSCYAPETDYGDNIFETNLMNAMRDTQSPPRGDQVQNEYPPLETQLPGPSARHGAQSHLRGAFYRGPAPNAQSSPVRANKWPVPQASFSNYNSNLGGAPSGSSFISSTVPSADAPNFANPGVPWLPSSPVTDSHMALNTALFSASACVPTLTRSRHGTDDFLASRSIYRQLKPGSVPWSVFSNRATSGSSQSNTSNDNSTHPGHINNGVTPDDMVDSLLSESND